MGEECARKRKHVFICRACCLGVLLSFIGCLPPVKEWQGRQNLREAESLMARGDYKASMDETLKVFEAHPMTLGDRALFQMGLLYAHPENSKEELRRKVKAVEQAAEAKEKKIKLLQGEIEEREKKLVDEQKEIEQLRNRVTELEAQLSKLKNVDLTIEKKKRAPLP